MPDALRPVTGAGRGPAYGDGAREDGPDPDGPVTDALALTDPPPTHSL
ncbi:hypothetical protein [Streptomyces halstedii]